MGSKLKGAISKYQIVHDRILKSYTLFREERFFMIFKSKNQQSCSALSAVTWILTKEN